MKKGDPVNCQYDSQKAEQTYGFSTIRAVAAFTEKQDGTQCDRGKAGASQYNAPGGQLQPFAEQPGKTEKQHGHMDFNQSGILILVQLV